MTDSTPPATAPSAAHADRMCPQCGATYGDSVRFCVVDGATLRPRANAEALIGRVVGERYHVLRRLGHGGMGHVYLAEHVRMKRLSALKVLHPAWASDPAALERFHREASNTSRISHPNVAAIHDFGETEDGYIYLAMEYIEGESLAAILRRERILPPRRVAAIVRQVADALDAAHHLGIVHRDLKPDNVMLTVSRDGQDHAKVVDFGIAKAIDRDEQQITGPGTAGGTPAYMSPEQIGGEEADARTDIYSLALVVYTMLVGRVPFPPANSRATLAQRLTEPPLTLGELNPQVPWPGRLQQVLDQALAIERRHRYDTVTAFARELEGAISLMTSRNSVKVKTRELPAIQDRVPVPIEAKPARSTNGLLLAAVGITLASAVYVAVDVTKRNDAPPGTSGATTVANPADAGSATDAHRTGATPAAPAQPPRPPAEPARAQPNSSGEASLRAAIVAATGDLDVAERRARAGEYEGAWVRFWAAERRIDRLLAADPSDPTVRALHHRLESSRQSARHACEAERAIAQRRGDTPPQCQ